MVWENCLTHLEGIASVFTGHLLEIVIKECVLCPMEIRPQLEIHLISFQYIFPYIDWLPEAIPVICYIDHIENSKKYLISQNTVGSD